MKTNIFMRFFTILLASAIFMGCSKEQLVISNAKETISSAKMGPVYNYGGISGTLQPAPYYAALKIYNDEENFATSCFADVNGHFKIGNLLPGVYRIIVVYIPAYQGSFPVGEYKYFEIRGINVEPGIVTELGDILLITK